ncbi:hypothetical protein JCM8097_004111 [Rhodosporidiobolus ruineniae]
MTTLTLLRLARPRSRPGAATRLFSSSSAYSSNSPSNGSKTSRIISYAIPVVGLGIGYLISEYIHPSKSPHLSSSFRLDLD